MDQVQFTAMCLDYSTHTLHKVKKVVELAESMFQHGSDEYYDYVNKYTDLSEKKLADLMISNTIVENTGREYMGVTIFRNEDGTYNVPELGLYNIDDAKSVKNSVKLKLSQTSRQSFKENCDQVIDNIFNLVDIDESEFFNFVLSEMSENDYVSLGGESFKDFVLLMSEVVNEDYGVPESLINESYIFDEGIGDFVKKVKSGVSDAHVNLSYAAPGLAASLGNAYQRHTDAVSGAKDKLANLSGSSKESAANAKSKISNAVSNTFNKNNLQMGARIAGATVKAASSGFNKSVAAVADNATAGVKAAASLTDKELRSRSKNNKFDSSDERQKSAAANDVLDKLRTDGDAERVEGKRSGKKLTSAEKGAMYDKMHKSGELYKEDLDYQLDSIKNWLYENDIFDNLEDIDQYILDEMTKDDYTHILSEIFGADNVKQAAKLVTPKYKGKGETSKERNLRGAVTRDLADATKSYDRFGNNHYDNSGVRSKNYNLDKSIQKLADTNTDRMRKDYDSMNSKFSFQKPGTAASTPPARTSKPPANYDDLKSGVVSKNQPPARPYNPNTGLVLRGKDSTAVSTTDSPSYSIPSLRGGGAPRPPIRPLGKAIDNPHSLAYKQAILNLHEPAGKQSVYSSDGSSLGRKSAPKPLGKAIGAPQSMQKSSSESPKQKMPSSWKSLDDYGKSEPESPTSPLVGKASGSGIPQSFKDRYPAQANVDKGVLKVRDDFADSLKNVFGNNKTKPSSIISTVGNKARKLAGYAVDSLKRKVYAEGISESDITNWLTEDEYISIAEYLIENDVFEDDEDLLIYLSEGLTWEDLSIINDNIEADALALIVEMLCDEETYNDTCIVLESVLGSDFLILLETCANNSDSDFYEPMPVKVVDCSCGKSGCKPCSQKSWKNKVYNKMVK
jgi:hypothetical protein